MLGECPNFLGGIPGKIRENGPKTGNSFVIQAEKCAIAILDHNSGKYPCYLFLDINYNSIAL